MLEVSNIFSHLPEGGIEEAAAWAFKGTHTLMAQPEKMKKNEAPVYIEVMSIHKPL